MEVNMLTKHLLCGSALLLCQTGFAQGYFDFGQVPGIKENPTVQIDLNPAMLGFVNAAANAADPEAAKLLAGIENVRVRVYEDVDDQKAFMRFIDDTSGELERDGWQRVVYVEEDDSKVRIYMKVEDTIASGITVMVADSKDEAVLINIAGRIDPTQLGNLMNSMGQGGVLDSLGDLSNLDQRPNGAADED
jgi:hypothetical protein